MYTHKLHVHKGVYILYTVSFQDPEITDYKHSFLPSTKLVLLLRQGTSSLPLFPRTRSPRPGTGCSRDGAATRGAGPRVDARGAENRRLPSGVLFALSIGTPRR